LHIMHILDTYYGSHGSIHSAAHQVSRCRRDGWFGLYPLDYWLLK
jgi:hypothetical protein